MVAPRLSATWLRRLRIQKRSRLSGLQRQLSTSLTFCLVKPTISPSRRVGAICALISEPSRCSQRGQTAECSFSSIIRSDNASTRCVGLTAAALITAAGKPAPPTDLFASAITNSQFTVNWSAPANTGGASISSYTITTSPSTATQIVTGTSATITNLAANTPYTVSITASALHLLHFGR